MITEKRFVQTHQSFWQALLPMMPRYVRTGNASAERFAPPLAGGRTEARGVINEAAFRLFALSYIGGTSVRGRPSSDVDVCVSDAATFISRFRTNDREDVAIPVAAELPEVVELADRLETFFRQHDAPLAVWPDLPGCGWLDNARADVMSATCLYEIKSGDAPFRGQDVRQVLCYTALAHAAGAQLPQSISLVNPRRGVYILDKLDRLCMEVGGVRAVDIINGIVAYVSEPQWEERF